MRLRQCIARAALARAFRKIADRFVRRGQRSWAQEKARRETLHRAADDAVSVLRLDLALDIDAELGQGPADAEYLGDVAERVFIRSEPRIDREVDAPAHHMLAVVVTWRQS